MNNIVSQRFIQCYQDLIDTHQIRSARQFAVALDSYAQTFNEILKLRRDVSLELVQKAVEVFHFNPHFLFSGNGPKFLKVDASEDLSILTIVADSKDREQIVHVPMVAQAGYTGRFADPVYIHELPCYSLPDFKFKTDGTMRSFEVSGESMEPTLNQGDLIICGYIHPFHWEKQIRDQKLYVFVTDADVVVKRPTNLLRSERKLLLHSDNTNFNSYAVEADKIKEVWQVKAKISTQLDPPSNKSQGLELVVDQLKNMILQQNQVLEEILEKVEADPVQ
ncbi:MAG: LexA family transcriptional regulator [Saprospiraceae bacterium]|nr:LexA family transcriptional regulator [Candidatus Vicinibacter affinis]